MRTETVNITLHIDARDGITRDEILADLRPLLEGMQEAAPHRNISGDSAWWLNRRSAVEINGESEPAQTS